MAESVDLCTYYKFHKHKIAFFLSSMRHFKTEMEEVGFKVDYHKLDSSKKSYIELLKAYLADRKITELITFEIEDKFMEIQFQELCEKLKLTHTVVRNPQFLVTRDKFENYLKSQKKPFMKTFYENQRREFQVLVDKNGSPVGGKFSFDEDNRLKWPEKEKAPDFPKSTLDDIDREVFETVNKHFPDHVGDLKTFWLPTRRQVAHQWLQDFCKHRLAQFGPYEDALSKKEDFLFHSALSPLVNIGLLTSADVIQHALKASQAQEIPMNSLEGFIRQVLGWREFIRGIYQNFSDVEEKTNFFKHENKLNNNWYTGATGCPPLDDAIKKAVRLSYNHHIERLMVICNIMNMTQIHPHEVHRWFMELYADSSDWVMGPNVYGMGLFSDGGVFATKPYICGSNYLLKMSSYKKEVWCDEIDGLYWGFIGRNSAFFRKNYRLSMMVTTYEKMDGEKKGRLEKAAQAFVTRNTI